MKLTKNQLHSIIKEELRRVVETRYPVSDEDRPEEVQCLKCGSKIFKDDALRTGTGGWVCRNENECEAYGRGHRHDDDRFDSDRFDALGEASTFGQERDADLNGLVMDIIDMCLREAGIGEPDELTTLNDALHPEVYNMIREFIDG